MRVRQHEEHCGVKSDENGLIEQLDEAWRVTTNRNSNQS